ncbi:hypothetical protein HII31_02053 [Pseudocercospora fuligena]|uniref:DUF7730 domain-containing protein n=1 Tax=Pseudocercospora fuligena TaxID=685502 RepID=A0A8H6RST5_9PEZI|nr:hypothetical protein HII31_02053 [Pseudocercospora fuligena]
MCCGNGRRRNEGKRKAIVQGCVFLTFGSFLLLQYLASCTLDQTKECYWSTYDHLSERRRDFRRQRGKAFLNVTKLKPKPQPQSTFLNRLPLELRQEIYDYVFDHIKVTIVQRRQFPRKKTVGIPVLARYKLNNRLALPSSCKQLYLECMNLLYTTTTFCFADLRRINLMKRPLPPSSWNMIRSIEVNTDLHWLAGWGKSGAQGQEDIVWNEFWQNVDSLEGLEQIRSYKGMLFVDTELDSRWRWPSYGPRYDVKFSHPSDGRGTFKLPSGKVFESETVHRKRLFAFRRSTPDKICPPESAH